MLTQRFYKEKNTWYADEPRCKKADNEMVAGADVFLEKLSNGSPEVFITFSDNNETGEFIGKLIRVKHNDLGGDYVFTGKLAEQVNMLGKPCWLCNVMHTVCGEHPVSIYIHSYKTSE